MIQVGDYIIYPAGLVVLALIPITFIMLVLTISKMKNKTDKSLFKISQWEKNNLPSIIDSVIKYNESLPKEEITALRGMKNYIKKEKYWNYKKLTSIYAYLPRLMYDILLPELEASYIEDKDIDATILLINAIDAINGRFEVVNKKYEWMDTDLISFDEPNADPCVNVVKGLWEWILTFMIEEQYPPEEEFISQYDEDFDDYLKKISRTDVEEAINELGEEQGLGCISDKTADIIVKFFFWYLKNIINEQDNYEITELTKEYLRVIACTLDRNPYPVILKTLV